MARKRLLFALMLLIPLTLAGEYSERILDVRQMIKDALDMMRSYPAPTSLIQTAVQQQQPMAAYYAQQHQNYYPPRRAYAATTYNGGAESQVDKKYGDNADSQPNYIAQVGRFFAAPTQKDMETLFHLPADVLTRLASDAGYIPPSEEQPSEDKYYKSSSPDQSFSFNIQNNAGSSPDLNSFMSSLQNQPEASTQAPVVDVPGPPMITTRQIVRDGKQVSIPILIIPQKGGENIYVPFSDMQQLSDAVNKIISTGHYQLTTPKSPDKPFPVPGPMPVANVQVEPPMQPTSIPKPKQESVQKTDTAGAFVQSFDDNEKSNEAGSDESNGSDESKEEEVATKKSAVQKPATETTTIPTTKATISPKPQRLIKTKSKEKKKQDEIVLNGHRYKLVAVESSAEASVENSESPETSEGSSEGDSTSKSSEEHKKASAGHADQLLPMNTRPEQQRQYSLKELEELYNKENALATRGDNDDSEYPSHQRGRISELREKFARERAEVAKQTEKIFYKLKPSEIPKSNEETDQKCLSLRSFARKYGVSDVDQFARNNCQFIEQTFPDLKCEHIAHFISECKMRMLML